MGIPQGSRIEIFNPIACSKGWGWLWILLDLVVNINMRRHGTLNACSLFVSLLTMCFKLTGISLFVALFVD
jgi:hypothetical protein